MDDLLDFLNSICLQSYFFSNDRLLFELRDFDVLVDLEIKGPIDYDYYQVNLSHNEHKVRFKQLLQEIFSVRELVLSKTEYLGSRKDLIFHEHPVSISKFFLSIESILRKYRDTDIEPYTLEINFGLDDSPSDYCNVGENYTGKIAVPEKLCEDLDLLKQIFLEIGSLNAIEQIPLFYRKFYQKCEPLQENEISILSTNTKVRRLGYFVILSDFFEKNQKTNKSRINTKFEDFAEEYQIYLKDYISDKGEIKKSKTGNSAKPYLELSKDLGFSNEINNVFLRGKNFKVYEVVRKQLKPVGNPFALNDFDRLYFLETILSKDFFYISSILELLYSKEKADYIWLKNNFQGFILSKLREATINESGNSKLSKQLKKITRRIENWEKAPKYLEHVIMPRLNWFLDLEFLNCNDGIYSLNRRGKILVHHFCYWNDLNNKKIVDSHHFLDLFYIHMLHDIWSDNELKDKIDKSHIDSRIEYYIRESFNYFFTLAPNRVTASQAINYAKYCLYLFEEIKVGFRYIENYLHSERNHAFIFMYQSQYKDGYIQLKNKI